MASWRAAVPRATETGNSIEPAEHQVCCKDGRRRDCIFSGIRLDGRLLATLFDSTARKQAELALHASQAAVLDDQRQARLAALQLMDDAVAAQARAEATHAARSPLSPLVAQSSAGVLITDLQGHIEYVNAAFLASSGYRRDEIIGQPMRLLKSGQTPVAPYASLWHTLKAGQAGSGDFINRRKDGSERIEQGRVWPLRQADGSFSRYAAALEDVTENRRMAEELSSRGHQLEALVARRTAELETARAVADAANRAKSVFLANRSHEIRTMLHAVIGLTHLLRRDHPTAAQFQRLGKIDSASQHLLSVLSDILNLPKIEADQLQLEQTDFDLTELLATVCALHAEQAQRKGLKLPLASAIQSRWLRGDPTRSRQAWINCVGNAIKCTERGTVRILVLSQADDANGVLLRFELRDTGPGIATDQLALLFNAFTLADASIARKHFGTGLGLAITRRIATLMGGEAGVHSTPGVGGCFWFTARLDRGGAQAPARPLLVIDPEAALREVCAGASVLLVENNPDNSEVAQALLAAVGLRVDLAETGQMALDKLAGRPHDPVLMDVQLPDMDGMLAPRVLRSRPALAALPGVAMAANAFADDRRAGPAASMNDFVARSLNPPDLYAPLLRWLPHGWPAAQVDQARLCPQAQPLQAGANLGLDAAAAPPSAGVLALIESWGPQARLTLGLPRGDAAQCQRLVMGFAPLQGQDMVTAQRLLADGRHVPAASLAQGLNGAASSLGAVQLAALADALETALHGGASLADCADLARRCDEALQHLVLAVQRRPDPPAAAD